MPEQKDSIFYRAIQGRLVTGAFFARHWLQLFIIVSMVILYMTNRYSCRSYMGQVRRLQDSLEIVESESYRVRGIYMGRIRESEMQQRLDTLGLDLAIQSRPPYHISRK